MFPYICRAFPPGCPEQLLLALNALEEKTVHTASRHTFILDIRSQLRSLLSMSPNQHGLAKADTRSENGCHQPFVAMTQGNGPQRSFSLNDIDCWRPLRPTSAHDRQKRSSSSTEALEVAARACIYPLKPCQPLPDRPATPPGIPSFGTKEAQELRLVPPSRFTRIGQYLQRTLIRTGTNKPADDAHATGAQPLQHEPDGYSTLQTPPDTSTQVLRRMLGNVMPVAAPSSGPKPRKSGLPRGVVRASIPGVLALAEDGSQVRGRFGPRASGHSVGQRTLNVHPLSRLDNSDGLQAAIEEIEKACAREDQLQQLSPTGTPQIYVPTNDAPPETLQCEVPGIAATETDPNTRSQSCLSGDVLPSASPPSFSLNGDIHS